jgi:hypothetical protein
MKKPTIDIRIAKPEERETVVALFLRMLEHLDQFEHEMLPLRENAEWIADNFLMPAAERGEPVLIAWEGDRPVAGMFWTIQELPYRSRWKMSYGYGTFVEEGYRNGGLGTKMRKMGFGILKEKGVERATGMVLYANKQSLENWDHMGAIPYARLDHYPLK